MTTGCSLRKLAHQISGSNKNFQLVAIRPDKLVEFQKIDHNKLYQTPPDQEVLNARPWKFLPKYFTKVLISSLALVKMTVHAKAGGSIEVMGMLTGKVVNNSLVVMDVYSLPVEGTETRVNAQNEAYEYMVQYLELLKSVGREEHIVGWYHSHPGYGCWLSGIDVATQSLNQNFQDPYLAIVVDPVLTMNQGKVDIGAFRTFPIGYNAGNKPGKTVDSAQIKSKSKKHDFGLHAEQYYALDIEFFQAEHDIALVDAILNKSLVTNLLQTTSSNEEYEKRLASNISTLLSIQDESVANHLDTRYITRVNPFFENVVGAISSFRQSGENPEVDDVSMDDSMAPAYDSEGEEEDRDEDDDEEEEEDDDDENDMEDQDDEDQDAEDAEDEDEVIEPDENADVSQLAENVADTNLRKRGLRTSSEESKLSHYFGAYQARTRKRFATGESGTALSSELKFKLQSAPAELVERVERQRRVLKIGHSELLQLISQRAKRQVFGPLL